MTYSGIHRSTKVIEVRNKTKSPYICKQLRNVLHRGLQSIFNIVHKLNRKFIIILKLLR